MCSTCWLAQPTRSEDHRAPYCFFGKPGRRGQAWLHEFRRSHRRGPEAGVYGVALRCRRRDRYPVAEEFRSRWNPESRPPGTRPDLPKHPLPGREDPLIRKVRSPPCVSVDLISMVGVLPILRYFFWSPWAARHPVRGGSLSDKNHPVWDAKLTFEPLIISNILNKEALERFKMPVFPSNVNHP